MNALQANSANQEELDLNKQVKSAALKPVNKSEEDNMEDLMKFMEVETNSQFSKNINDHSLYKNNVEVEQQEIKQQRKSNLNEQKVDEEIVENVSSLNPLERNGLQEKDASLQKQLAEHIREKELIQSKFESVTNELVEKERNTEILIEEATVKDAERQKLLDSLDLQKTDSQKDKDNLLKRNKQIDLLTNELADFQLQLAEKTQENKAIQHKYATVIEELTINESNVKKLRNEATLKDLEYKRLLDNMEKDKRKIDAQNKDIIDLTERLATQVHDKELIQCKLESVSEELQNLRNEVIARQDERKKLLESIERLGLEKAENQKSKEELERLTEKCKHQNKEIVNLRKTLNMQITFTTIVILSAAGIIGWNYFISES